MTLTTGDILNNRYRIARLVGQGGFGAVYHAWDTALNRRVAVKENFDTGPQALRQFKREAELLAALRHPNLPVVGDHFILPGQGQYLVMDFVEGKSLDQLLHERGGPLNEGEVLPWVRQVCGALTYLHTRTPPIIHRDIKPKNIIITPDDHAMLVDFGISKVYDPHQGTTIGAKGITPGYSPPEQYGRGRTDARSDIYALGATLYTLLTGQQPPEGPDLSSGADELTPPRHVNPAVSAATSAAIVAAMAPKMEHRLQSADALARALTDTTPIYYTPPQPTRSVPPTKTSAHHPVRRGGTAWRLALGVLGIVALVIWAVWTFRTSGQANNGGEQPGLNPQATQLAEGGALSTSRPSATPTATATATLTATPTFTPTATATPRPSATPSITPTPLPQAGDIRTVAREVVEVEQVYVQAGSFVMGSDGGGISAEQPAHGVTLDSFWLDRTEVTNAQYEACVVSETCGPPSQRSSQTRGTYYDDFRYSNYPVVNVNWDDASAFCQWAGGRLPTEAEWEYAARGPESFSFPWGNDAPTCDLTNYGDCLKDTTEVGSYPDGASWVNALDMAGNVWEWVNDWYHADYYRASPGENPTGPATGSNRVERGGAFYSGPNVYARSAYRASTSPTNAYNNLGFRCAQDDDRHSEAE